MKRFRSGMVVEVQQDASQGQVPIFLSRGIVHVEHNRLIFNQEQFTVVQVFFCIY